MTNRLAEAYKTGSDRLAAWADLLDRINVFPIADGDTGRNMVISLAPLGSYSADEKLIERLMLSARGNSGNISARFFSGFLEAADPKDFAKAAKKGRDLAYRAVEKPKEGTMLSVFDALARALGEATVDPAGEWVGPVVEALEQSVRESVDILPELKKAGVVDSGALGVFIFFDAFLKALYSEKPQFRSAADAFADLIKLAGGYHGIDDFGACIDAVIEIDGDPAEASKKIAALGESVVAVEHGRYLKVHLHADDKGKIEKELAKIGSLVSWSADDLKKQTEIFRRSGDVKSVGPIHLVTDAAGSVTHEDALDLGFTVLDSYILMQDKSIPETHVDRETLYRLMSAGALITTGQASEFERHQHYDKLLSLHDRVLYLCVGSVYTGNHQIATDWKKANKADRLTIIDTGAASGRLGLITRAVARFNRETDNGEKVIEYARKAIAECRGYVFLETLTYLARGGRLSKSKAFFGNLLGKKPIISVIAEGAVKAGVVKNREEQIRFIKDKLAAELDPAPGSLILAEYSDNAEWVGGPLRDILAEAAPNAEIMVGPLSLTSGVHMGPGTWGVAFCPKISL